MKVLCLKKKCLKENFVHIWHLEWCPASIVNIELTILEGDAILSLEFTSCHLAGCERNRSACHVSCWLVVVLTGGSGARSSWTWVEWLVIGRPQVLVDCWVSVGLLHCLKLSGQVPSFSGDFSGLIRPSKPVHLFLFGLASPFLFWRKLCHESV